MSATLKNNNTTQNAKIKMREKNSYLKIKRMITFSAEDRKDKEQDEEGTDYKDQDEHPNHGFKGIEPQSGEIVARREG